MKRSTRIYGKLRAHAWHRIENDSLTMADAVSRLLALGNSILEVDEPGRRVKCMDTEQPLEHEVFVCEKCGAFSRLRGLVEDHERLCNRTRTNEEL